MNPSLKLKSNRLLQHKVLCLRQHYHQFRHILKFSLQTIIFRQECRPKVKTYNYSIQILTGRTAIMVQDPIIIFSHSKLHHCHHIMGKVHTWIIDRFNSRFCPIKSLDSLNSISNSSNQLSQFKFSITKSSMANHIFKKIPSEITLPLQIIVLLS